ncbi:YcfA-like protein [archaeon BMS3Bbin15]|nr:YcfA-like protein [archaeon BMS3Bbin15]
MSKLPVVSGKKVLSVLVKYGFYVHDQKGSHIHLRHPEKRPVTIPNHKTIAKGTLRAILKEAGINLEEFLNLLIIIE